MSSQLPSLNVLRGFFVLQANVFEHIRVELDVMPQQNGPRRGKCFGIVHGHFNFGFA